MKKKVLYKREKIASKSRVTVRLKIISNMLGNPNISGVTAIGLTYYKRPISCVLCTLSYVYICTVILSGITVWVYSLRSKRVRSNTEDLRP